MRNPWFNKETLVSQKQKDYLSSRLKKYPTNEFYRQFYNEVKKKSMNN